MEKRRHLNAYRPGLSPNQDYWNFYEDCPEQEKISHVLRYNADPNKAYTDGRMEVIIQNIVEIGNNLRGYENIKWSQLLQYTHEIFDNDFKKEQIALKEKQAS